MVDFRTFLAGDRPLIEKTAQFLEQVARAKMSESSKYIVVNGLITALCRILYSDIKNVDDAKRYATRVYEELIHQHPIGFERTKPNKDLFVPDNFN